MLTYKCQLKIGLFIFSSSDFVEYAKKLSFPYYFFIITKLQTIYIFGMNLYTPKTYLVKNWPWKQFSLKIMFSTCYIIFVVNSMNSGCSSSLSKSLLSAAASAHDLRNDTASSTKGPWSPLIIHLLSHLFHLTSLGCNLLHSQSMKPKQILMLNRYLLEFSRE